MALNYLKHSASNSKVSSENLYWLLLSNKAKLRGKGIFSCDNWIAHYSLVILGEENSLAIQKCGELQDHVVKKFWELVLDRYNKPMKSDQGFLVIGI